MTARSCEEISKELEEMWSLRETWQTPEQQLLTDPKIEGLIERLKWTCGPTTKRLSGAARSAQDLKSVEDPTLRVI